VKDDLQLTTETYDLFGHSAGGQIAHRLALFSSNHNAKRILAANSGWYTVPTDEEDFPVGLKNSGIRSKQINFTKKLVLFIGEKDNANETRGELRHTPELDKQGLHRLSRGRYFYRMATKMANESGSAFNWNLEIVPGIGHDYQKMSEAAADYLYRKPN